MKNSKKTLGSKLHSRNVVTLVALFVSVLLANQSAFANTEVIKGEIILRNVKVKAFDASATSMASVPQMRKLSDGSLIVKNNSEVHVNSIAAKEVVAYDAAEFSKNCAELIKKYSLVDAQCEPNFALKPATEVNDPLTTLNYGLNLMQLPQAWDLTTGSTNVVVAVIDTGVDYNHEDLAQNIWANTNEVPENGIDDDNNGYTDDYFGANFITSRGSGFDDMGHGTHVAGIIGALGNNGRGLTGINWNTKIMPLKFISSDGYGSVSTAVEAIDYAIANGARVINASWGALGASSTSLESAIRRARDAGILFVAAAGNDATNIDQLAFYPAAYELGNVVSVTATDENDQVAGFANYGTQAVDIAAPGVNIPSTYPGSSYVYLSGTSMAAPQVAGLAALLLSRNPNLTWIDLKRAILDNADVLPNLAQAAQTSSRINAFKALEAVISSVGSGAEVDTLEINVSRPMAEVSARKVNVINGPFLVKASNSSGLEGDHAKLTMQLKGYSCKLMDVVLTDSVQEFSGRIPKELVGTLKFELVINQELKAKDSVVMSKRNGSASQKSVSKLTIAQSKNICRQIASSLK